MNDKLTNDQCGSQVTQVKCRDAWDDSFTSGLNREPPKTDFQILPGTRSASTGSLPDRRSIAVGQEQTSANANNRPYAYKQIAAICCLRILVAVGCRRLLGSLRHSHPDMNYK